MSKEDLDFGDIKISYEKKIDNKASLPSWKMFSGFLSYPILSYPILSYPILPYPILSYPILSYPILSYPILSYPILFYPILSYPILSYPVLSCPVLFCSILSYLNIKWSVYCQYGSTPTILSVLAVHRPFYFSICISTLPTQHTTFIPILSYPIPSYLISQILSI